MAKDPDADAGAEVQTGEEGREERSEDEETELPEHREQ